MFLTHTRSSLARGKKGCRLLEDSLEIIQVVCFQTCLVHETFFAFFETETHAVLHCRTSIASSRLQWALPDFNREFQIPVGTAGLQPRVPDPSGHCRTSTESSRFQWALLDFNRQLQIPVGTAGLQPRAPDPSAHCRTSTCIHPRKNAR
eukprot:s1019_g3.t1